MFQLINSIWQNTSTSPSTLYKRQRSTSPFLRLTQDSYTPRFGALDESIKSAIQSGHINSGYVDFVPTPEAIIQQMLVEADLQPGYRILEPSAGQGHLAEAINSKIRDKKRIDVVELQPVLRQALEKRGFSLKGDNILNYKPGPIYDRILMNPPFGFGREWFHTMHCFSLLKPGGKLITVLPNTSFGLEKNPDSRWINFNTGNQYNWDATNFLLDNPDISEVKVIHLPPKSFLKSDIPNPVETSLLILTRTKK
jgi:hypothetical protein